MTAHSPFTRWFDGLGADDRALVGGKCANLGELIAAGMPVPRGFAVTVTAFEEFARTGGLVQRLRNLTDRADLRDGAALRTLQKQVSAMIHETPMPERIEREIRTGYAVLCERTGVADVRVAVRSSAVAEDGSAASFAGQQETYLWIRGVDSVLAAIRDCWASLFTPQAVAYRARLADDARADALKLSVAVQEMVDAEVAGVAFTVSPTSGDPSVVAINAAWGLGEAVVSGEVTPDEYWLSKVGPHLIRSTIAAKDRRRVPAASGNGTVFEKVPADLVTSACLQDAQLCELAQIAMRVERHYGSPQDIEWALARDGADTRFVLLQTRPETVHAARRREARAASPSTSWLSALPGLGSAAKAGD